MTKKQVKTKINRLFKEYTKKLEAEIGRVLTEADMWYGYDAKFCFNEKNPDDRNADLFASDGVLDDSWDIDHWLHTRKEIGI